MDLSEEVAGELHTLLSSCGGRIQDYYVLTAAGKSQTDIASEMSTSQPNVSVMLSKIRIIRHGPQSAESPSNLTGARATLSAFLRRPNLSTELRSHLESVKDACLTQLGTLTSDSVEDAVIQRDSENLEEELTVRSASGVYVYSSPVYRKAGWFKVGQTKNSAWSRIASQIRSAGGYPDGVEILRVYLSEDPLGTEQRFHRALDAARHGRSSAEAAGTEWFQTNLSFLDTIADLMGLKTLTGEE